MIVKLGSTFSLRGKKNSCPTGLRIFPYPYDFDKRDGAKLDKEIIFNLFLIFSFYPFITSKLSNRKIVNIYQSDINQNSDRSELLELKDNQVR